MEKTKSKLRTEMLELLERDMHTHEHYRFQDDVDDFEYNRLYRLYHNFEFDSLYCHRKELVVYHPDDLQAVCECDDCSFCYDCPALRLDNIYKLENKEGEMKQLKRNECAVLPLVLKGKWYDMIASGEKKEEYRDRKLFWQKRIRNVVHKLRNEDEPIVVAFSRGYKKQDMFFVCDAIIPAFEGKSRIKIEWGEPETPHYILRLGERVELVD